MDIHGKRALFAVGSMVLSLCGAGAAKASCPTIQHLGCCGTMWYQLDVDSSCFSGSGATSALLSCGFGGYSFGTGSSSSASWTFTVPADGTTIVAGDHYYRMSNWSVAMKVDFDSPTQSFWDWVQAKVYVNHNGTITQTTVFTLAGNTATSQGCGNKSANFSATNGDTITVTVSVSKLDPNANIKVSLPIIFNQ